MSAISEIKALQDATAALQLVEDTIFYLKHAPPEGRYNAKVGWDWGSAKPGFREIQSRVQRYVNDMLPDLLSQAAMEFAQEAEAAVECIALEFRTFPNPVERMKKALLNPE